MSLKGFSCGMAHYRGGGGVGFLLFRGFSLVTAGILFWRGEWAIILGDLDTFLTISDFLGS